MVLGGISFVEQKKNGFINIHIKKAIIYGCFAIEVTINSVIRLFSIDTFFLQFFPFFI